MQIRHTTGADAEAIAALVGECDAAVRPIAPPDWTVPPFGRELAKARAMLAASDHWLRVAELDGELAGYVVLVGDHLRRLFVRPAHWGTGVGTGLHAEALRAAVADGITSLDLVTPAWNARARRFYEREGWVAAGESPRSRPGLPLIEYRRAL